MNNFKELWNQKQSYTQDSILLTPQKIIKINPDSRVVMDNNNIGIDIPVYLDMEKFLKIYDEKECYLYKDGYLIRTDGIKYKLEPVDAETDDILLIDTEFENSYDYEPIKELYFNIDKRYKDSSMNCMHSVFFHKNEVAIIEVRRFSLKYTDVNIPDKILIPFNFFKQVKTSFSLSYKSVSDKYIIRIKAGREELYFKINEDYPKEYPDYNSIIPATDLNVEVNIADKKIQKFLKEGKKLKLDYCHICKNNKIILSDNTKNEGFIIELDYNIINADNMTDDHITFYTNFLLEASTITDKLFLNAPNRPAIAKKDNKYLHLVMPLIR